VRYLLIADAFPPLRTSGAIQLRDLSMEFIRQGHSISVMLPDPDLLESYSIENWGGVQVIRLRTPALRGVGYFRRTFGEFLMPFFMLRHWRKSPLIYEQWDGIIWYSPSIFFGPLVKALKTHCGCKAYLIIRDIFPDWALDLGLIGRGLPYQLFKVIAILANQLRGSDRTLRLVADYSMPNVSDKVVRIIHSYTDYVNRVVWKKY
jgi:hypothetical protein